MLHNPSLPYNIMNPQPLVPTLLRRLLFLPHPNLEMLIIVQLGFPIILTTNQTQLPNVRDFLFYAETSYPHHLHPNSDQYHYKLTTSYHPYVFGLEVMTPLKCNSLSTLILAPQ